MKKEKNVKKINNKLSNDQKTKNYKLRKIIRIFIILDAFLVIVTAICVFFLKWTVIIPLGLYLLISQKKLLQKINH